MWLLTTRGFCSVVAHRDDPDIVLVRARVREDLEALDKFFPDLDLVEDGGSDYRWRAFIDRTEWEQAAAALAAEIDYPNFKNAVAERQGPERADVYHDVWATLRKLQT